MKTDADGGAVAVKEVARRKPEPSGEASFGKLQFHPLVMAFPRLSEKQFQALVEDVIVRGSPVVLRRGEIILGDPDVCQACIETGIDIEFREWDGQGELGEVVARSVLAAGQLDPSQRAVMAVALSDELGGPAAAQSRKNLKRGMLGPDPNEKKTKTAFLEKFPDAANCAASGSAKQDPNTGLPEQDPNISRAAELAAELCQVSPRYVYEARKLRDLDRDLFERVKRGELNLSKARVAVSKIQRQQSLAAPARRGPAPLVGGDELLVGDCLAEMAKIRDGAFPLIFADPPYNNGWTYDCDPSKDLLPEGKYHDWSERWIKHCARLLAPDGSIFVMIDSRWQGRFDVLLRNAGLHWRNTIVWRDPFPTHTDLRFQPSARFIHYFTRSAKNFRWNADAIRVPSRRDEIGDARRVHDKGIVPHDVWDCPRIVGNSAERVPFADAPPQIPALILERCILAASEPGDRVFDPFCGNGTTWKAARKLGRKFTGIERSEKYAAQARQWANG